MTNTSVLRLFGLIPMRATWLGRSDDAMLSVNRQVKAMALACGHKSAQLFARGSVQPQRYYSQFLLLYCYGLAVFCRIDGGI